MDKQKVISELNERFPNVPEAIDSVVNALLTKRHCILWGKGGHAKSTIVEKAVELLFGEQFLYEEVKTIACSEEVDMAHVIGYPDMKEFRDGRLVYRLDETVYQYKVVVLEEGLNSPPEFLPATRDPLTRQSICVNRTCLPSKLQSLFICTNVNPYEWANDSSRQATIDRFHFVVKTEWPDYKVERWDTMFKALKYKDYEAFSLFAERDNMSGDDINPKGFSPRSLVYMMEIYKELGLDGLKNFNGMTPERFAKLESAFRMQPYLSSLNELTDLKGQIMNDFENNVAPTIVLAKVNRVKAILDSLKTLPVNGEYTDVLSDITRSINWWEKEILKRMASNPLTL